MENFLHKSKDSLQYIPCIWHSIYYMESVLRKRIDSSSFVSYNFFQNPFRSFYSIHTFSNSNSLFFYFFFNLNFFFSFRLHCSKLKNASSHPSYPLSFHARPLLVSPFSFSPFPLIVIFRSRSSSFSYLLSVSSNSITQ